MTPMRSSTGPGHGWRLIAACAFAFRRCRPVKADDGVLVGPMMTQHLARLDIVQTDAAVLMACVPGNVRVNYGLFEVKDITEEPVLTLVGNLFSGAVLQLTAAQNISASIIQIDAAIRIACVQ